MSQRILLMLAVFGAAAVLAFGAFAQDVAETPAADVAGWIRQLDADRFADRQAASEKLIQAGARAISALSEAAETGSAETSARAIDILGEHLAKGDAGTQAASRSAMEKLAESKSSAVARRAKAALEEANKPQTAAPNPAIMPGFFGGRIQIRAGAPAQIQIQVQQNAGQARRITITNNNGVKHIDAEDGGRRVKIKDDPQNGIEMEVTETKNGQPVTEKYQAKDADDLKRKHPDAHKLYDEYAKNAAQIQVRPAGDARRRLAELQMNHAQKLVESIQRSLDNNGLAPEQAKAVKQHLDNVKRELEQAQRKLAEDNQKDAEENPAIAHQKENQGDGELQETP